MWSAATYFRSWFGRFETLRWRRADAFLWVPAAALIVLGALMVLNTTYFISLEKTGDAFHFFKLHLAHIAVGLAIMLVLSQFSLRGLRRLVLPLMVVAGAMLLALWVPGLGVMRGGARRWLRLGPMLAEPSEVVKLAAVFFLADLLSRRQARMREFAAGPLVAFAAIAPVALLILIQPDFGTTVMLAMVLFVMLYAAGARLSHLGEAGGAALVVLGFQAVAKSYRIRRLSAFLDPWQAARGAGFQLIQSFIALAAGRKWGVGLGAGRQKMFYLPQAGTDFVFAVVGEELGLVGACAVIALFVVILVRGMRNAHDEPDQFASLLGVGLSALIALEAAVNIAVVIGMIPTKGLALPFLSYGGTAIVTAMAELGTLLALARRPAVAR